MYDNLNCCYLNSGNLAFGTSQDIEIDGCESEIRADIVLVEYSSVRLWGRIIDCEGCPIPNALVKLLRLKHSSFGVEYEGIAHTTSDCEGFYQFDICTHDNNNCTSYKILVSQPQTGCEKIIPYNEGNCNPCFKDCECCNYKQCQCCNDNHPFYMDKNEYCLEKDEYFNIPIKDDIYENPSKVYFD